MSFFDDLPEPPEDEEPEYTVPVWHGPPQDMIGAVAAPAAAIARTDNVFIGLRYAMAYPTGLALSVMVAARRGDLSEQQWQALDAAVEASDPYSGTDAPSAGRLRWEVELADGRRVSTSDPSSRGPDGLPRGPVLLETSSRGSSGAREVDRRIDLWLWPLPEGAALSLVVTWPDLQIPATTHRIDLASVRTALTEAVAFWP